MVFPPPPAPEGLPRVEAGLQPAVLLPTATLQVAHEALIREWPTLRTWLAEARHWMLVFFAFIVVFLSIQALKPAADLMGPHTAGMRAP